jgi:hypothetical protein
MKRLRYLIRYGDDRAARFSSFDDAIEFARHCSGSTEVSDFTGLVAQFADGKPTPEFQHLERRPRPWRQLP